VTRKMGTAILMMVAILVLSAAPAFAHHKSTHYPPGCQPGFSQGKSSDAPGCQKHQGTSSSLSDLREAFESVPAAEPFGITVGMLMVAGSVLAVVLVVQHRRRLQALRR